MSRPPSTLIEYMQRTRDVTAPIRSVAVIFLQFLLLAPSARGQATATGPQSQAIDSVITIGEVFVNESRAPSELTIFSGDTLRTGDEGTAILNTGPQSSLQISRQSQVVFAGDTRYLAELKQGTIFVKTVGGAGAAVLRAGNFVVVPTNRSEQSNATIQKMPDGSFLITCSEGNIGVIPLQKASGLFLQAGQSARISANSELLAVEKPNLAAPQSGGRSRLWIYLGLAGGGIAAGTVAAIEYGGGHTSISPTAP